VIGHLADDSEPARIENRRCDQIISTEEEK
jgi:hypothetical protein